MLQHSAAQHHVARCYAAPYRAVGRALVRAAWLGLLLTAGLGCDATPGPAALSMAPPTLSNVSFAPTRVVVADLPPDRVGDETILIDLQISATATDPDGTVERVVFTLEPSQDPGGVAQGDLTDTGNGRYELAGTAELPRAAEQYTIRLVALDDEGNGSDTFVSALRIITADE